MSTPAGPSVEPRFHWSTSAQPTRSLGQASRASHSAMRTSFNMTPGPAAEFNDYAGLNPAAAQYVPSSSLSPSDSTGPSQASDSDFLDTPTKTKAAASFAAVLASTSVTPHSSGQTVVPDLQGPTHGGVVGTNEMPVTRAYPLDPHGFVESLLEEDDLDGQTEVAGAGYTFQSTPARTQSFSNVPAGPSHAATGSYPGPSNTGLSRGKMNTQYAVTAHHLAEAIKRGEMNSPQPLHHHGQGDDDHQPLPVMGPPRFNTKDFVASADAVVLDRSLGTFQNSQRPPPELIYRTPDWFELVTKWDYTPKIHEVLDALPLIEPCRFLRPSRAGVLRISDIPYASTRAEIIALVGRNARILAQPLGSQFLAVHIVMERETGKTMDCFIELVSQTEAQKIYHILQRRIESGRPAKVGDRRVVVELSSQEQMMHELFPRAKNVRWRHNMPVIDERKDMYYADQPATGFKGLVEPEELFSLAKHAGLDNRAPFASRSPVRMYETVIMMVHKYPWHAIHHVTLDERRALFDMVYRFTKQLIAFLNDEVSADGTRRVHHPDHASRGQRRRSDINTPRDPTVETLHELAIAGLTCPGFSERQKRALVEVLVTQGYPEFAFGRDFAGPQQQQTSASLNIQLGGQHDLCSCWPFQVIGLHPACPEDVKQFYTRLFREATLGSSSITLDDHYGATTHRPMGDIRVDYGADADSLTLADAARIELEHVENLLHHLFRAPRLHTARPVPQHHAFTTGSSAAAAIPQPLPAELYDAHEDGDALHGSVGSRIHDRANYPHNPAALGYYLVSQPPNEMVLAPGSLADIFHGVHPAAAFHTQHEAALTTPYRSLFPPQASHSTAAAITTTPTSKPRHGSHGSIPTAVLAAHSASRARASTAITAPRTAGLAASPAALPAPPSAPAAAKGLLPSNNALTTPTRAPLHHPVPYPHIPATPFPHPIAAASATPSTTTTTPLATRPRADPRASQPSSTAPPESPHTVIPGLGLHGYQAPTPRKLGD